MSYVRKITIDQLRVDYPAYAEGCLKIVDKRQRLAPLVLNHSQGIVQAHINRLEAAHKPIRIIELKARQTGLSTDAEGRIFHRCHLRDHRQGLVVAHVEPAARKIFRMSRIFYENLPEQLRLPKKYFTKGLIEFESTGSAMQVVVANKMGGRAFTAPYIHFSEAAFYPNLKEVIAGALQAVPSHEDTIVIFESTPFGHNEFYDLWQAAKAGDNDFVPIFVPWFDEPTYRMNPPKKGLGTLDDDELELVDRFKLDDEQLAWRRWCIPNNCGGDAEVFLQEYPSDDRTCFLASGRPAFDRKGVQIYIVMAGLEPRLDGTRVEKKPLMDLSYDRERKAPVFTPSPVQAKASRAHGCRLYRPPVERVLYTMGADVAEGVRGGARSSIAILNRMTLDYEFFWYGWTPPEQLVTYMDWIGRWYNNAEALPEYNNHGYTVVSGLTALGYPSMWYRPESFEKQSPGQGERMGYLTNRNTRQWLFNCISEYVRNRAIPEKSHLSGLLEDPECVGEMLTSVYDKKITDRIDKLPGTLNDVVFAAALALFAHKGDPNASIEPLPFHDLRDRLEPLRLKRRHGERISPAELLVHGLTAEELEQADEEEHARARSRANQTGGRMA
jgi:hypothetical protein